MKDKIDINETSKDKNTFTNYMMVIIAGYIIVESLTKIISYKITYKYDLFIICSTIYFCLIILDKIIELNKKDIYTVNLENLEYEIYVKDLQDDKIREILQQNYMGYLLNDWINYIDDTIKEELSKFKKEFERLKKRKENLDLTIDKQKYPLEYDGRIKILNEEFEILRDKTSPFFKTLLKDVKGALKNSNSLDNMEKKDLGNLHNKLIETIRYIHYFKI
ncbi:hypothetical protein GCM10007424_12280 [Flavobacterium suaedae]|uniref:Uncharacterized protein n=1 Tax=Flavobacterium suaedae TaxID=1767027 RepID=A0ABQ1JSX5_9FLAO|nr:hypothetical protein [Flavobacterium suaedae]GGB73936.1 hypothetical protein GCM10007424_12280 [Flavobacterium suaedae]